MVNQPKHSPNIGSHINNDIANPADVPIIISEDTNISVIATDDISALNKPPLFQSDSTKHSVLY